MKKRISKSLVFRIGAVNLATIAVIMAIIAISVGTMLANVIGQNTNEKINLLANENATVAGEYLNTLEQTASTLKDTVISYQSLTPDISKAQERIYANPFGQSDFRRVSGRGTEYLLQ